jgi:hypothetical protein
MNGYDSAIRGDHGDSQTLLEAASGDEKPVRLADQPADLNVPFALGHAVRVIKANGL